MEKPICQAIFRESYSQCTYTYYPRPPPRAAFVKRKARGVQTRPKHETSLARSSLPILFREIEFTNPYRWTRPTCTR